MGMRWPAKVNPSHTHKEIMPPRENIERNISKQLVILLQVRYTAALQLCVAFLPSPWGLVTERMKNHSFQGDEHQRLPGTSDRGGGRLHFWKIKPSLLRQMNNSSCSNQIIIVQIIIHAPPKVWDPRSRCLLPRTQSEAVAGTPSPETFPALKCHQQKE